MPPKKLRLVLASQSPRRREILREANLTCLVFSPNSSESFDENLTLHQNLRAISKAKVEAVYAALTVENQKEILILGADTVVVVQGKVLGKPKNRDNAVRMLGLLSDKKHLVKTSFSLYCPGQDKMITRVVTTVVGFRKLSKADIKWYVNSGQPFDKAGGYGIQGLAQHFVNYVNGDFLNVVGLPLNFVRQELRKHGWNVGASRRSAQSKKSSRQNRRGRKKGRSA